MTLAFSTQLNGKPTYFVEKICKSLRELCPPLINPLAKAHTVIRLSVYHQCNSKNHTIRADEKDRWQPGKLIHFVINNRTKNRLQFAPVVPVVSTQKIKIHWFGESRSLQASKLAPFRFNYVDVVIDGNVMTINQVTELAQNDGFDSIEDFFTYFKTDFKGKIIHWTDLKY